MGMPIRNSLALMGKRKLINPKKNDWFKIDRELRSQKRWLKVRICLYFELKMKRKNLNKGLLKGLF